MPTPNNYTRPKRQPGIKKIQNPSEWKLSILLIPVLAALVIVIATRSTPTWVIIMAIASVVAFMAALTYHCIRQKCYGQLALNYLTLLLWGITAYIQFHII